MHSAFTACEEEGSVDKNANFLYPNEYLKVKILPSRRELSLEIQISGENVRSSVPRELIFNVLSLSQGFRSV